MWKASYHTLAFSPARAHTSLALLLPFPTTLSLILIPLFFFSLTYSTSTSLSFVSTIPPSTVPTPSSLISSPLLATDPFGSSHPSSGSLPQPFSLASSFSPIPAKLVQKIKSAVYVDMKELLPDNIIAMENVTQAPSQQKPKQREIRSILTWLPAFITYTAILADHVPYRTRELLAYMRLIIREARRSSENGWLNYIPAKCCSQPPVVLGQSRPVSTRIFLLEELPQYLLIVDHWADECATHNQTSVQPLPPSVKSERRRVCLSWNSGQCMLPGSCTFLHVCATCREPHRARDCQQTPLDSMFKRPRKKFRNN